MNHKLSALHLGVALGLTWAIGVVVLGLSSWLFSWGGEMAQILASIYHGYAPTVMGLLWGALWAFVDGFIGGLLIAWIYNCCQKCRKS